MANRRKLRLHKYQIDEDQYQELFYFSKRYRARKEEINNLRDLSAVCIDGMPKGSSTTSQTESKAIKIDKLQRENEIIEQAAIEVDKLIAPYIIKNVTEGVPYEYMKVPCGRRQFYEKRRLFFKVLSEIR